MCNVIPRRVCTAVMCLLVGIAAGDRTTRAEGPPASGRLVLEITNRSRVTGAVVTRALTQTCALFDRAGIDATCLDRPGDTPGAIPVSIVDEQHRVFRALPPHILGAVVKPDEGTSDAVVLAHRVDQLATRHDVDFARLLGHVIAHEVAHLFLPPGHAERGLMRATWEAADVMQAIRGQLRFTTGEAQQLRLALAARRTPAAARR